MVNIKNYRQLGDKPKPESLDYGVLAVDKAGNLYAGDEHDVPQEIFAGERVLSDATRGLYGLGAEAVPDDALKEIAKKSHDSLLRDLNIMMNLSLGTSNIDAWADLLVDASRINAGLSSGYFLNNGQLTSPKKIVGASSDEFVSRLGDTISLKIGQEFTASVSGVIDNISFSLAKVGNPTDALKMIVYADDKITHIATASALIVGASLTRDRVKYFFPFLDLQVSEGKKYFIEISRTGAQNASDYYQIFQPSINPYPQNSSFELRGATWIQFNSKCFYFSLAIVPTAVVIWNPVTASEALSHTTVVADLTLGTGWVKFYLSQDGVTWIEVLALNAAAPTNFTSKNVYLKCVMFGDSVVRAVAWGGY